MKHDVIDNAEVTGSVLIFMHTIYALALAVLFWYREFLGDSHIKWIRIINSFRTPFYSDICGVLLVLHTRRYEGTVGSGLLCIQATYSLV